MSTPVTPLIPALMLARVARLNFRATSRDRSGSTLGVLVDGSGAQQHLSITSGTSDVADGTWALSSTLPPGVRPILLYESAANVLRGGVLNADGSISYQGGSYLIESSFDGNVWTAKVSGSA